jgi:uncharacterized membrane protein
MLVIGGLTLLLIAMFGSGCQSDTTKLFQQSVQPLAQQIADDTSTYAAAVADPAQQAVEQQLAKAMADAVATPSGITRQGVRSAWTPLRSVYLQHVATDDTLDDDGRQVMTDSATQMDALLDAEDRVHTVGNTTGPPTTAPGN